MTIKLDKINTQYSRFIDNQVLTSHQLNEVIDYFDDQDRLSRVFLQGVGIACGFELKDITNESMTISGGVGVTTDGDLIVFKKTGLKADSIEYNEQKFSYRRKFNDKLADYFLFNQNDQPIEIIELLQEKTDDSEPLSALNNWQQMCVLLYLESYEKEPDLCTAIDCDNQGIKQQTHLRVLLVSKKDAEYMAKKDVVFSKHDDILKTSLALKDVFLKKVVFSSNTNVSIIKKNYHDAIKTDHLARLRKGLNTIFQLFGMKLDLAKLDNIFEFNENNIPVDFQYRYDLLYDLILSYNEIKSKLLNISSECLPPIASFPKHLLLGVVSETAKASSLRHRFYYSSLSEAANQNLKRVKSLLARINLQIDCFQKELKVSEIKIVPSVSSEKLGDTSIPFYYGSSQQMREVWNFRNNSNQLRSGYYFVEPFNKENSDNPLLYIDNRSDFYRIEGQLEMDAQRAVGRIAELIKTYGLDFELIYYNLDSEISQFQSLINSEPSIEHIGGVYKGGTFILIGSNSKIIADFSLKYRYNRGSDSMCCPIKACSYPWISSLKYLNNLSRSQKGTKKLKVIPETYKLHVLDYRINDTSFVRGIEVIEVPIPEIMKRRMHAVVDTLNSRYPHGLVFDYNESQKRFVITYNGKDKFVFRVRDATLNSNSPIYTYSETGLLKSDRVHRIDAMICREIVQYNNEFYKKLHHQFAPLNKDDDYGMYYKKWKEWERIIDELRKLKKPMRIFKSIREMPENIYATLSEIKSDFKKITPNIALRLDGDWVNGTWVDENMLIESRKDSKSPAARFIRLRKLLHNKTGVSRLSIYVYNKPYRQEYDALVKKYEKTADFYFTVPSGPHAKEI